MAVRWRETIESTTAFLARSVRSLVPHVYVWATTWMTLAGFLKDPLLEEYPKTLSVKTVYAGTAIVATVALMLFHGFRRWIDRRPPRAWCCLSSRSGSDIWHYAVTEEQHVKQIELKREAAIENPRRDAEGVSMAISPDGGLIAWMRDEESRCCLEVGTVNPETGAYDVWRRAAVPREFTAVRPFSHWIRRPLRVVAVTQRTADSAWIALADDGELLLRGCLEQQGEGLSRLELVSAGQTVVDAAFVGAHLLWCDSRGRLGREDGLRLDIPHGLTTGGTMIHSLDAASIDGSAYAAVLSSKSRSRARDLAVFPVFSENATEGAGREPASGKKMVRLVRAPYALNAAAVPVLSGNGWRMQRSVVDVASGADPTHGCGPTGSCATRHEARDVEPEVASGE